MAQPKLTRHSPGSYSINWNGQSLSIRRQPWGYGSSCAGMWIVSNDNDRFDVHDPVWTLRQAKLDIESRGTPKPLIEIFSERHGR